MWEALAFLGWMGMATALLVLARLSRRLGHVTKAPARYRWAYLAAFMVFSGGFIRLLFLTTNLLDSPLPQQNIGYIFAVDGLPALGFTIGLLVAWYYWSWLLTERD